MPSPPLPSLTSESIAPDGLTWTFTVPANSPFFVGHFPGHPILPGVVALAWMLAAAEQFAGRPAVPAELLNVKFQVVITPGAFVELTVARASGGRLRALIRSEAGVHASALIPCQEA